MSALFVSDAILESQELGKCFLLPGCGEALVLKMNQALLICVDDELSMMQVWSPLINCNDDGQILLFICRKSLVPWGQGFAHEDDGVAFLLKHGTNSYVASICLDDELLVQIW